MAIMALWSKRYKTMVKAKIHLNQVEWDIFYLMEHWCELEPAGPAPLRASFTNGNDGPINPFTGKPPQPAKEMTGPCKKQFVRNNTHLELKP